uniref:Uncharacterized protein n=1 Tax=Physcomitrium patens TaxID=3218 RepID=A0A2K1JBY3_PHYPA|nr:hypothetical protein PHYPA_019317 [Physcomitrium patens]
MPEEAEHYFGKTSKTTSECVFWMNPLSSVTGIGQLGGHPCCCPLPSRGSCTAWRVLFFLPFPGVVVNNSNLSFSLLLRHRILRGIFPDHSLAHLLAHSLSPLPSCTFPFMAFLILSPTRSDVSSARRTPLQPATTVPSSSRGVENSIHLIFRRPTQCAKSYNISAPGSTRTYIFS